MTKLKLTDQEQVAQLMEQLEPSIREMIAQISTIILAIDPLIAAQVKWNSVSFYYTGEMTPFNPKEYKRDILVCNVHRGKILLVLPSGAKVKDELKGKDYPDGRKIITITDLGDVKTKENGLIKLITHWISLIE